MESIWICGVGGVGGYFGGRLTNKISNMEEKKYKIYFLARGEHLEEIKKKGLELHTSEDKVLICKPTLASDNVNDFPVPDLCLICVKSYDLDDLIRAMKKRLTNNTIIISLMNGFDIYDRIRKIIKKSIILPSCVYVGSHIEKSGLVIQSGNPGFFYSGFDPMYPDLKPQPVINFFNEMGIDMRWEDNPNSIIWQKFLLVASFALVSAHTGQTLGSIIDDESSREILEQIMKEIVMISEKKGIALPNNVIKETIEFCKDYPDVKPSYARDIEKGKINEGDLFGGALIRLGKKFGIPTPITASIYKG
jgi:2-dehydropantoate 2-reductase